MIHKGQTVERRVRQSGITISKLADELNMTRQIIYRWFAKPDLENERIYQVGEVINHDFSEDFWEMREYLAGEPDVEYSKELTRSHKRAITERDKYLALYLSCTKDLSATSKELQEAQKTIIAMQKENAQLRIQLANVKPKK